MDSLELTPQALFLKWNLQYFIHTIKYINIFTKFYTLGANDNIDT